MRMLRFSVIVLPLLVIAGCTPQQVAQTDLKPLDKAKSSLRPVAEAPVASNGGTLVIRPVSVEPSNPAVATRGDLPTYVADLDQCRARVAARLGRDDADNIAAVRRAIADRPLNGKLTVHFAPGDAAMVRDQAVRKCLRGRGYALNG